MPWWAWVAFGALLLVAEMGFVDLEFYLVFLGVSAMVVGLVGLAGVELPPWGNLLLFAGVASVSFVFFRRRVYGWLRPAVGELPDNVVGEIAVARDRIEPGGTGQVELRGTPWNARNVGETPIEAGQRAPVDRTEGVTVLVRSES
jgi:membrane protein implicated in regulation of membrane protease activity